MVVVPALASSMGTLRVSMLDSLGLRVFRDIGVPSVFPHGRLPAVRPSRHDDRAFAEIGAGVALVKGSGAGCYAQLARVVVFNRPGMQKPAEFALGGL